MHPGKKAMQRAKSATNPLNPGDIRRQLQSNAEDELIKQAILMSLQEANQQNGAVTGNSDEAVARQIQDALNAEIAQEQGQKAELTPKNPTQAPHRKDSNPVSNDNNQISSTTTTTNSTLAPVPPATRNKPQPLARQQLIAVRQQGATCGLHAAANALAIYSNVIQDIPQTNKSLQSLAVTYYAEINTIIGQQKFAKSLKENVDNQEIMEYLQELTNNPNYRFILKDAQFYFYGKYGNNPITFLGGIYPGHIDDNVINYTKFNSQENGILNFIYNTGGHWVTVCAVKKQGQQPTLYFVDSAGGNSQQASDFLAYLDTILR